MIKIARTELFAVQIGGEGGRLLRISSDRDNRRIFWGLKFSISGFFGVGKFWQVFFYLSRDFLGYSKTNICIFRVVSCNAFWKFLWLGNSAWDFLGLNFGLRSF